LELSDVGGQVERLFDIEAFGVAAGFAVSRKQIEGQRARQGNAVYFGGLQLELALAVAGDQIELHSIRAPERDPIQWT